VVEPTPLGTGVPGSVDMPHAAASSTSTATARWWNCRTAIGFKQVAGRPRGWCRLWPYIRDCRISAPQTQRCRVSRLW
jgi:hypothetical protein